MRGRRERGAMPLKVDKGKKNFQSTTYDALSVFLSISQLWRLDF
jgi:hypothetical protein